MKYELINKNIYEKKLLISDNIEDLMVNYISRNHTKIYLKQGLFKLDITSIVIHLKSQNAEIQDLKSELKKALDRLDKIETKLKIKKPNKKHSEDLKGYIF